MNSDETDERYLHGLDGLSRLSVLDDVASRNDFASSNNFASRTPTSNRRRARPKRKLPLGAPHSVVATFEQTKFSDGEQRLVIGQLIERAVKNFGRDVVGNRHVWVVIELHRMGKRTDCEPPVRCAHSR